MSLKNFSKIEFWQKNFTALKYSILLTKLSKKFKKVIIFYKNLSFCKKWHFLAGGKTKNRTDKKIFKKISAEHVAKRVKKH